MIEFRRIHCPIDFSEFSRRALAHAVVMARRYKGKGIAGASALRRLGLRRLSRSPAPLRALAAGEWSDAKDLAGLDPLVHTALDAASVDWKRTVLRPDGRAPGRVDRL